MIDLISSRIYVAGHRGLVGSAIVRRLTELGCKDLVLASRAELDLRDQSAVQRFLASTKPQLVFAAAATVGGIMANSTRPAEFCYDNLAIELNLIHSSWQNGVKKLLFLGSSCIYPRMAPQPIREDCLLTGELEPTNEPYAIAKIAGLKLSQAYRRQYNFPVIGLLPTNLYGPGDNFDPASSHVLPALLRRFHEGVRDNARSITLWGTGTPRREFMHVDDMASAACFVMQTYDGIEPLNVGVGQDISIAELAQLIARITGFRGEILFDSNFPDGTPLKLLDISRITALGWKARIGLEEGITATYDWYRAHSSAA